MSAADSVRDLLRRAQSDRAEALDHDGADLGEIQRAIGVQTLFDSLVVVQNFLDPQAAAASRARHGIVAEDAEDSTHFPLTWVFTPGDELALKIEHRRDLIDGRWAQALADIAVGTLRALTAAIEGGAAEQPIAMLPVPTAHLAEVPTSDEIAAAQRPQLGSSTVIDAFRAAADRHRDDTALVWESQRWTFAELADRCAALAQRLAQRGIGVGDTVAVAIPRSADVVVAILGTLWSGARYVPLDLGHPDPRLADILDDCRPELVLVSDASRDRFAALPGERDLADIGELSDPTGAPTEVLAPVAGPDDDAYVIYTSGSTGRPKGVVIAHGGLINMLHNHRTRIFRPAVDGAGRRFRVAHAISFAFDMSWEELLWLAEGHEVHVCGEDLRRDAPGLVEYVHRHRIDVINVTPSHADQLVEEGLLDADVHRPPLVLLGGEAVSAELWAALRGADGVRGYNLYGPTEYTINTLGAGTDESVDPVVGQPIDNTVAMILDPWLRPVPDGVAGELYVTGIGIARSYLGRAAQTAASMVACPLGRPGERMYRTGDLVRRRADGMIEYLGRTDDQVKIRGHRVDPAEVSAAVMATADGDVAHCVTVPRDGALICHLVATPDDDIALMSTVRDRLRRVLPDYLVPLRYSVVERLPLTVNGKVDADALGSGSTISAPGRPPEGDDEELVAELVAEALDLDDDDVAADADFFAIGGHSMAAVRLVALLRAEFDVRLTVRDVYDLRRVEDIARKVGRG